MAEDNRTKWRRFQKLSFNSKTISKKARKAEKATVRHAHKFIVKRWKNIRQVRQAVILWVLAVGLLIAGAGVQLLWYRQGYETTAAATAGTYAEAVLGPINTLNPLYASTSAEESLNKLLFSSLLTYDTTGTINTDLARTFTIGEEGKTYDVALKQGLRWHDGRALTADDVIFTVGLIKDPATRSVYSAGWNDVTIKKLDDLTVRFTLQSTYASFPHALMFPVLPKHILADVPAASIRESDFGSHPIGSGPFQLRLVQDVDTTAGRKIVHLVRNTTYHEGGAKLARIQLHTYPNRESILRALQTGEVSAAADLTYDDTQSLPGERFNKASEPINSGVYALFNTKGTILSDKAVRQALQVGTDTSELRKGLAGEHPALDLPFLKGQLTGAPTVPAPDQKRAAELLDGAGWKLDGDVRKKDGVELKLDVSTTKDPNYERALESLVGQWRKLGVLTETQVVSTDDVTQSFVQTVLQPRNFDVLLYQLTIGADPDVYAYWHSSQSVASGFNFSSYSSVLADDALASARVRLDPELRTAKYVSFARQWVEDAPALGLYQSTVQYVSGKSVTTFNPHNRFVTAKDRYADVVYWASGTKSVYKTP